MAMATASLPSFALADLPTTPHSSAERALMQGRIDEAITGLHKLTDANPKDGAAHFLLCRAFYAEDHADEAIHECEAALANGLSNNSQAQDWMGRVYGKKADQSGPLTGLKLAHKVKEAFEAAVNLDPKNADATDDLAEYYLEAPSIVGGGLDRARALADKAAGPLPERAQRLRGLIAEKQKDPVTAERELRSIAEASPNRPDGWLDLASFYSRAKNYDQAVAAATKAVAVNKKRDPSLYQTALTLIEMHRGPKLAEEALRSYLAGNAMEDGAPAFKAHYQLGKLLAASGDTTGAKAEYAAALALASNFAPARKALQAQ
jgi:tetratricopeptide (TPR) repeat protein